ncbi:MAG: hypothetical protein KC475_03170 [Cyanobacteria bacterium HKST-UBA03]|nr:hypothetical protein [Cyanobacteria bacterium HKST-UBA03]
MNYNYLIGPSSYGYPSSPTTDVAGTPPPVDESALAMETSMAPTDPYVTTPDYTYTVSIFNPSFPWLSYSETYLNTALVPPPSTDATNPPPMEEPCPTACENTIPTVNEPPMEEPCPTACENTIPTVNEPPMEAFYTTMSYSSYV